MSSTARQIRIGTIAERRRRQASTLRAFSRLRENELLLVCAWCESAHFDEIWYEGAGVPASALARARLTHGICPRCIEREKQRASSELRDRRAH